MEKTYILLLSCYDEAGIVFKITKSLYENKSFILESSQFSDFDNNIFFIRIHFRVNENTNIENIKSNILNELKNVRDVSCNIYDTDYKPKVMILVSKQDHCLNELLNKMDSMNGEIKLIASNHNKCRNIADYHGIDYYHLPIEKDKSNILEQEEKILELYRKYNIDLIILARYMQILSPNMCKILNNKAINIHHSFLPSFKGAKPYHQAYNKGVKIIGATAHFVTDDLDEGPIIEQDIVRINHSHNVNDFVEYGKDVESKVLSKAVKYFIDHRIILYKNKTIIFN